MALMQNGFRDFSTGVRIFGATVSNSAYPSALMGNFWRTSTSRNMTAGTGITTNLAGIPDGYRNEASWVMPKSAGALGARNQIIGVGTATITVASGVNGEATLTGAGDMAGVGQLIISMVAALTGAGTISSAQAEAFLQLAATLTGAGDIAGALSALGSAAAVLQGTGDLDAVSTALGMLAANITVTGDVLTTANVADSILDAADGVESGLTLRQALRVIAAATAGKVSGAETTTITFRNALVDDVDRIIATVDSNGNRTAVTLDTD
jgi:hypothetical protein